MDYDQLNQYMPEAAVPGFRKALSQVRSGSVEGAMNTLKSLITSYGDHQSGEIRSVLCQLEIHTGKFKQALHLAQDLTKEFPDRTFYHVLEAQCLYLLGKNASALKNIRAIKEINDAYENYAIVYNSILNLNGMKSKSVDPFREAFNQWQKKDLQAMEAGDRTFGLIAGCDILGYEADDNLEKNAEADLQDYLDYLDTVKDLDEQSSSVLAQHISQLNNSTVTQNEWSRKLFQKLLAYIEKRGFLSDHPETINSAYINIEYHNMDEDPKAFTAVKECMQAFSTIHTHKQSSDYTEHDQFMDKVDQATYQWIFAELRKEHMEEIDYARTNYSAYWNEINDYLNEEEDISKVQESSVATLVKTTGLSEKQVLADLKDQYDKLIHIDPAKLQETEQE